MRLALPILIAITILSAPTYAQSGAEGKTVYSRDDRIRVPFELRSGGQAVSVKLFYSLDGGAWQEYETIRAGQRREFTFKAEREGVYSLATMTIFNDNSSDPPSRNQLAEQRRVVVDRTPPKILSLRSVISADGAPGIEWEVVDDNIETRNGIKLEFRWPDMGRFEPIDRGVPFAPRDHRHWQLKQNDRMQVRVVAYDKAGNKTESDPVWVSLRDGEKGTEVGVSAPKTPKNSANDLRDQPLTPAGGSTPKIGQPSVHFVKDKKITLNYDAVVGPSGLTHSYLYWANEKLEWLKATDKGPSPAPQAISSDKPRVIPLSFEYDAEKDGVYNFIIIAENHRGLSRKIPIRGDSGDIQVIVDTTKPVVEILSTKVSPSGDRGAIVDIRWKASDINIAPIPIKLEYSQAGKNEWKAISDKEEDNTGQFTWTAPTGEAHEFDIRISCKDRAGNTGLAQTKQPVNVDLAKPSVEYKDVIPGGSGIRLGNQSPPEGNPLLKRP